MTEPSEEEAKRRRSTTMDLDIELDGVASCWPLDQINFPSSNPMSPLLLSTSSLGQQPFSPLWAFSDADANDDKSASAANLILSTTAALRLSDYHPFLSSLSTTYTDPSTEKPMESDFKQRPFPAFLALSHSVPEMSCLIKERMTQALRYFKESTEQHVLAQVWAPVKSGGRYVLTTSEQPFVLDPHSNGLNQYRIVSWMYMFSVDGDDDENLGLPGRVFRQKLPEWTPNVQYYSSKEYSRLDHALHYNVQGTLALPVFEPSGQSCVGVVELILTSQKINYAPEVEKVCKALEAVNLKSSEVLGHPKTQICNEGRQNALAEILEILTAVCETHNLPLAQTWVPCRHRSVLAYGGGLVKSCSSFDGSCMGQVCMSTSDVSFYLIDAHMWGFREACAEHHLQKGQGVAGKAFESQNSCFCADVTQFSKTEYPLVHYARLFGVTGCFSICLRSNHTGNDEYVLEFFLPSTHIDLKDQQNLLDELLETMEQHFRSLKVASGSNLTEGISIEIVEASASERLDALKVSKSARSPLLVDVPSRAVETLQLKSQNQLTEGSEASKEKESIGDTVGMHNSVPLSENKEKIKKSERKHGKTEITISLDVLQQYFAGSLKDAAKCLGVCPTTMKRICRQHGISRWPSRKINKVNRSLTKLKHVIESVHGADGTFDLSSLASSPLPAPVGSISWPINASECSKQNAPGYRSPEQGGAPNGSPECQMPRYQAENEAGIHMLEVEASALEGLANNGNVCVSRFTTGSNQSKTSNGSAGESVGTPISQGSCQGSLSKEALMTKDSILPLKSEDHRELAGSIEPANELNHGLDLAAAYLIPDLVATLQEELFRGMLVEDAGSSKDLSNLCPSVAGALEDEQVPEPSWAKSLTADSSLKQDVSAVAIAMPHYTSRQDMKTITMKAMYREDIIRFRMLLTSGIVELKEEVGKRLKLEVGTFDIKYLDDDQEWVMIACDADLQECLDICRSSKGRMIRLSVNNITPNLRSSCESTGE